MRMRRTAAFAATMILCVASFSARAGDARFEVDLLVGAAFPSHHPGETLSSVDPYGTTTSNALRSEAKTGLSYGARVRYVGSSGLGIELLYERARLDLDSTTRYDLAWDSVVGPRSESYRFTGSGTLFVATTGE